MIVRWGRAARGTCPATDCQAGCITSRASRYLVHVTEVTYCPFHIIGLGLYLIHHRIAAALASHNHGGRDGVLLKALGPVKQRVHFVRLAHQVVLDGL